MRDRGAGCCHARQLPDCVLSSPWTLGTHNARIRQQRLEPQKYHHSFYLALLTEHQTKNLASLSVMTSVGNIQFLEMSDNMLARHPRKVERDDFVPQLI